jgi:hypothetical protein
LEISPLIHVSSLMSEEKFQKMGKIIFGGFADQKP